MAKKVEVDFKLLVVGIAFLIVATVGSAFATVLIFRGGTDKADSLAVDSAQKRDIGPTYEIGEFVLNLAPNGVQNRFIRTEIVLEIRDKKTERELEKRMPQVRDQIISLVRAYRSEELRSEAGLELLRLEIVNSLNRLLLKGEIINVFFVDLYIQ
ncbi:MAG: hypothetical protein GX335_00345 [Firmicutes bacterium]|nr:hypothetical protein [Bacillota bacterium]